MNQLVISLYHRTRNPRKENPLPSSWMLQSLFHQILLLAGSRNWQPQSPGPETPFPTEWIMTPGKMTWVLSDLLCSNPYTSYRLLLPLMTLTPGASQALQLFSLTGSIPVLQATQQPTAPLPLKKQQSAHGPINTSRNCPQALSAGTNLSNSGAPAPTTGTSQTIVINASPPQPSPSKRKAFMMHQELKATLNSVVYSALDAFRASTN